MEEFSSTYKILVLNMICIVRFVYKYIYILYDIIYNCLKYTKADIMWGKATPEMVTSNQRICHVKDCVQQMFNLSAGNNFL